MTLSLASVTPDEALHSDLEPPASLKIDTKGLPPRRAELAKLAAWREAVLAELEILSAGRRDLSDHIRKLEREVAEADSDTASSADSVLPLWNVTSGRTRIVHWVASLFGVNSSASSLTTVDAAGLYVTRPL